MHFTKVLSTGSTPKHKNAESNWHRVRKERLCAARIVTDRGPEWHPGLIASIEHATGWKYDEREDLKNANASDYTRDPFTTALMAVSERFVETDPDIRAARALCDYKANNSTYLAMTTIKRRMDDAKWAWQSAQANLDTYLVDRAERQAMSPKNEATKEWREREEARKSARKVLAEITDHPEKLAW